ncbi:MAG: site-2 protease family protein [Candidatus Beckwithbacteria bacterium]
MLLIIGIGWGKPVPVDMRNFRNPIRGSALTALAGPTSNFITAIILAVPLKYFGDSMPDSVYSLTMAVFDLSILLGVFNLLPIPPLDGSKVLGLILPERWHRGYMGYLTQGTMFFVVFLVIDMFLIRKWFGVSVLGMTIGTLYSFVRSVILLGT